MRSESLVRQAIIEALAPPKSKRLDGESPASRVYGSTCPLPPWQFALTRLFKAVNTHQHSALLNYLYHPNPSWDHEAGAVRLLWHVFRQVTPVSAKREKRLAALCYLSLQDYRCEVVLGRRAHHVSRVQELCEISGANWRRDWLPHWREFKRQLDRLDTDALLSLHPLIE